jgi:hypothetical protein
VKANAVKVIVAVRATAEVKVTAEEKAIMAKATAVATNSSFKRSTYQLSKNFNNR